MNKATIKIRTALISVSDKTDIIDLVECLIAQGITIISTGGTAKKLAEHNIEHRHVSDVTGFPEIMQGRVKTLHPKIHGGILGLRDQHQQQASEHEIEWIDLVVCNLYPFAETIKNSNDFNLAVENIDIGGPTMIRAAAKNMGWVTVVVDPADYPSLIDSIKNDQVTFELRKRFAVKAFTKTAQYDAMIATHFSDEQFPETLVKAWHKVADLRYGENPHQQAVLYQDRATTKGLFASEQLQGKALSYNNYLDTQAALNCVKEFSEPACVVVKHANPCGVAVADNIFNAFKQAFEADSVSAFGGIIALNQCCDEKIANYLSDVFFEIIIAPDFYDRALTQFSQKKNLRVLRLPTLMQAENDLHIKSITGGVVLQEFDAHKLSQADLVCVTKSKASDAISQACLFAWKVVKHVKSNAIVVTSNNTTLGVGPGQVSRVGALQIALEKAGTDLEDAVIASDAFFPFRDSIDLIAKAGIQTIIQPGGSMHDQEVIDACDEYGICMLFTNKRCFNH